ncbi:translation initiation factor 2, partial [Enterococcus faecalis]
MGGGGGGDGRGCPAVSIKMTAFDRHTRASRGLSRGGRAGGGRE